MVAAEGFEAQEPLPCEASCAASTDDQTAIKLIGRGFPSGKGTLPHAELDPAEKPKRPTPWAFKVY